MQIEKTDSTRFSTARPMVAVLLRAGGVRLRGLGALPNQFAIDFVSVLRKLHKRRRNERVEEINLLQAA